VKIGRNQPCPCGSGKKFKKCCALTGVPWNDLLTKRDPGMIAQMSIRGRNLAFLHHVAAALQLDNVHEIPDWRNIKRACTPAAVRTIHKIAG
jgi:hypothetical protein